MAQPKDMTSLPDVVREFFALEAANVGTWEWDIGTGEVWWSDTLTALFGLAPGTFGGTYDAFLLLVHPDDRDGVHATVAAAYEAGTDYEAEFRVVWPDGTVRWLVGRGKVIGEVTGSPTRLLGAAWDITGRKHTEAVVAARARQQAAVAEFGKQAVTGCDLAACFDDAVTLVAETLDVEYAKVLELLPNGRALRLRSGVGWQPGLVGQATVDAGTDSQAGYTLLSDVPVIVTDLRTETRFSGPPLLHEHGVVSGLSVVIRGRERPYGVLGAHTIHRRTFTADDANFLRAIANILAATIQRERAEADRRVAHFRSLVQYSSDLIVVLEPDSAVRYVSDAVEPALGYRAGEFSSLDPVALYHPDDLVLAERALARVRSDPGTPAVFELRARHREGHWRWFEVIVNNRLADPEVSGIVLNARDVTERKKLEAQLTHQALHDPLTGLPNRLVFMDRLEHALARVSSGHGNVAVLFLDLDRFKAVNDGLGHAAGDELLVSVGHRLSATLRSGDTVARLGGDEFTVLLEDIADVDTVTEVAERLLATLRVPFGVAGRDVTIGASIGVALNQFGLNEPEALLRAADSALYRAKVVDRGTYAVFEPTIDDRAADLLELEADLRRAVAQGQLVLHYQPKVELASGQISGLEALVRWQHPVRGLLGPNSFIPLAEESGLIVEIGEWVLREACRRGQAWQEANVGRPPLLICVNVATRQLRSSHFVTQVKDVLSETGLCPTALVLEITERTVADDVHVCAALRSLKALGVRLAIDDFGTGTSSLGRLRQLPVDILKLDRSFARQLVADPVTRAVVRLATELAHELGVEIVAEGIETPDELRAVQALGVDCAQGYFFARPLRPDRIGDLLAQDAPYRQAIAGVRKSTSALHPPRRTTHPRYFPPS